MTAVSAVLCLATLVLWVRSGIGDAFVLEHSTMMLGGVSLHGACEVYVGLDLCPPGQRMPFEFSLYRPAPGSDLDYYWEYRVRTYVHIGRFALRWGRAQVGNDRWGAISFPDWFLVAVFAWIPIWVTWRQKRQRRMLCQKNALCIDCGYDLRATPDRCPECGTKVSTISIVSNR